MFKPFPQPAVNPVWRFDDQPLFRNGFRHIDFKLIIASRRQRHSRSSSHNLELNTDPNPDYRLSQYRTSSDATGKGPPSDRQTPSPSRRLQPSLSARPAPHTAARQRGHNSWRARSSRCRY